MEAAFSKISTLRDEYKGAQARAPLGHGHLKVQFRFILTLNKLTRFFCNEKKVRSQNKYLIIFYPHRIN